MLKRYFRRHSLTLFATAALSGLAGFITMVLLAYTNKLATIGIHGQRSTLVHAGSLILGVLLTSTVAQLLLARMGADLVAQLRTELAHQFLAIDYEKVANRSHAIFGAVIQDLGRIGPLVLIAPQLAYNVLLVVLCSGYLFSISKLLYLILAVFMGLAFFAALVATRFTRSQFEAMRKAEETFFEHLRAISAGKKELSLDVGRTNHFSNNLLRPAIEKARSLMLRVHLTWAINDSWSSVALNCALFGVVFLGYTELGLRSDTILQFVIGGLFIVGPLNFFAKSAQGVGMGFSSLRHLESLGVDLQTDAIQRLPRANAAVTQFPRNWQSIVAEKLTYRYPEEPGADSAFGVGPVTFTIQRGEIVFFAGGNGSGKSTLLLLICGLLTPKEGRIQIDGRPVQEDMERYRDMFCGTFSDCFIFRHVLDSVGGVKSDEEVKLLLKHYRLDGQVQVDHGQLSRIDLSTGQRKRLALIQSFAQDRDIYFFDEWAAEQDPRFRESFYRSVLPDLKRRGKTVIAISHDDRYFHLSDRIFYLESGLIVAPVRPPVVNIYAYPRESC
jgi:cyclic peptide transporter